MTNFQVTVLGSGSAMPTTLHNPPSQLIDVNEKLFMVDCGEGTQIQMRRFKARINKLHSIFISHLHGDHIFGLPGLLSTLSLLGRTGELTIYAHADLAEMLNLLTRFLGDHLTYPIRHIPLQQNGYDQIFESRTLRVFTFPLRHRIPTNGFLFEEKEAPRHIIREMIQYYKIPLKQIQAIKNGADFVTSDGTLVKNSVLTYPSAPPRRYAYCSDTAYLPEIIPHIANVDVLYHEATFAESEAARAKQTFHSTAAQAAQIAKEANVKKLVIGHFSSRYPELNRLLSEAQAIFPNTELAEEGKTIEL